MADETEKSIADDVKQVGKDVGSMALSAGKATIRGLSGDLVGAGVELLKNPKIIKAVIALVLGILLLILAPLMLIGTAIVGTIDKLASEFEEAWDTNLKEMGIESDGSALYLYVWGYPLAGIQSAIDAVENYIKDLFTSFHILGGEDASNNSLGTADGKTEITEEDYKNTIKALGDTDALKASLTKRLDMIKGRVQQRGEQIYANAINSYGIEATAELIAVNLHEILDNPILYGGVNSFDIHMDNLAFTLSDIQALKIYAAYSIQHDIIIEDADMWDLMDYCGWYSLYGKSPLIDSEDKENIYQGKTTTTFSSEIGGVVNTGDTISSTTINFDPPNVPNWKGTFAPQWYYEEQKQIEEMAKKNPGKFATNSDGEIDFTRFKKLNDFEPFGIIDKLYTTSDASLTIDRTEYFDATSEFRTSIYNKLSSLSLKNQWDKIGAQQASTYMGNTVSKSEEGVHSLTLVTTKAGCSYYLESEDGSETAWQHCDADGDALVFSGLQGNTTYSIYEVAEKTPPTPPARTIDNQIDTASLPDWETDSDGNIIIKPPKPKPEPSEPEYSYYIVENFTTLDTSGKKQAYKLDLQVNIIFSSKSVDSLLYDMIGLWPGSLNNIETQNGIEYAKGHKGNPLLQKTWTDIYTDPDGNEHTITFERQQGNQIEAYQDIIRSVADILGINVAGMYSPHAGYGDSIVEVAMKELEYYTANSLSGGGRYWDMATEAGGNGIGGSGNTPWCACFVMTCAWQCGYIGEGQAWGTMGGSNWPFITGNLARALVDNGNGQLYETPDYKPVPGDLIFFDSNGAGHTDMSDHIGIVVDVLPDDSISVVHGNWSNSLTITQADNYAVGSVFVNTYITSYVHPNYPAVTILEPVYMSIPGTVMPSTTARMIEGTTITGLGRLRQSQWNAIVPELKKSYPQYYSEELQSAIDANDTQRFISEWNKLFSAGSRSDIKRIEQSVYSNAIIKPIVKELKDQTGFDWQKNTIRGEILWGLVTTSDQKAALIDTLSTLSAGLDNEVSDAKFLETMKTDNHLYGVVASNKNSLWPHDSEALQDAWLKSIEKLVSELSKIWEEKNAQFGDPNAPVQDQVYYYLTRTMGFTPAAASGVMANIEKESGFNPNAYGDFGTSYGLCQWHNGRFTNLRNFCTERNLDFTTVQGQMEFLKFELTTQYAGMVSRFRSTPNTEDGAYDAAYDWCVTFEVPSNMDAKGRERGNLARSHYWPNYGMRG